METNNLTIIPPEGMEWYQDGDKIKFRPIEKLTYDSIAYNLFYRKSTYRINSLDAIICGISNNYMLSQNCTSVKQAKKLLAINKLMNIAKYLNGNWKPNWDNIEEDKFYIRYNQASHTLQVGTASILYSDIVYFKSEKLAQQAIEILGEETVKLALSTDW